jgi:hypothetical protein
VKSLSPPKPAGLDPQIYIIIWLSPYVLSVRSLSPPKPAGLAPQIYIIIWLSPYILFVKSLSPPKPAGLDPPNFCRHAPNWLQNTDSQKKMKQELHGKNLKFFWVKFFFSQIFLGQIFPGNWRVELKTCKAASVSNTGYTGKPVFRYSGLSIPIPAKFSNPVLYTDFFLILSS